MTEVINKQSTELSRAHARVDCTQSSTQSGFINKPGSPSTGAHTRVREEGRVKVANKAAYFKAWRKARFGGDFDPVRMAVDEAVAAFSSHKPADAQARDGGDVPDDLPQPALQRRPVLVDLRHREARKSLMGKRRTPIFQALEAHP